MNRRAFTLVELLVSVALIGVLSSMVLVGLASAQRDAKIARTKALIQRIDEIVQAKFDEYRTRRIPVVLNQDIDDANRFVPSDGAGTPFLDAVESARVRLVALRDLMRMEMPDSMSDVVDNPQALITLYRFQQSRESGGTTVSTYRPTRIDWLVPSRLANYRLRVGLDTLSPSVSTTSWTAENDSAECLWLFLTATTYNGISAMEMISPSHVKDTDGDGVPEIVDAWGTPISWIRWPAGSDSSLITGAGEDEFDLLASDWGYHHNDVDEAKQLIPMIVSAGPDGELGVVTSQVLSTSYGQMTWPVDRTDMATTNNATREFPRNSEEYPYIDPFARQYSEYPSSLPGSRVVTADPDIQPWADDISSLGL